MGTETKQIGQYLCFKATAMKKVNDTDTLQPALQRLAHLDHTLPSGRSPPAFDCPASRSTRDARTQNSRPSPTTS